jgi:hypothetical protein
MNQERITAEQHTIHARECEYCCDSTIKRFTNDEELHVAIKIYCSDILGHRQSFTFDDFEEVYLYQWGDLSEFAESVFYDCYSDRLCELPEAVENAINWGIVWESIRNEYYVHGAHVFSIKN